jgi:hypothetical protein
MQTTVIPCGYAVEGLGFYFVLVAQNPKLNSEEKSVLLLLINWQCNLKNYYLAKISG